MTKQEVGLFLLRFGLGGVFLWFGIDKFFNPSIWAKWIPDWALLIEEFTFVYILGVVESILGILLLIGLFTGIAALISSMLLMMIAMSMGYNDIMIRDVGLLFMAAGIMMLGPGDKSFDSRFRRIQKLREVKKSKFYKG